MKPITAAAVGIAFALSLAGCTSTATDESADRPPAVNTPFPAGEPPVPQRAAVTAVATECTTDPGAPEVRAAIESLPPYSPPNQPDVDWQWSTDPGTIVGNYDSCATLSTAMVTVEGATGSSPVHALLFNAGRYVGTADPAARPFTSLDEAHSTDDTVVLTYRTPGSCNACDDGTETSASYHWDGNAVQTTGHPPR